ncbi:hypothetical protein CORAM0001_1976, partial [Corynebacterium amycolatum SK46]
MYNALKSKEGGGVMFGRFTNEKRWLALFSFMAVLALFFAKS